MLFGIFVIQQIRTGELYIIDSDYVTENVPFLRNKEIYPLELSGNSFLIFNSRVLYFHRDIAISFSSSIH